MKKASRAWLLLSVPLLLMVLSADLLVQVIKHSATAPGLFSPLRTIIH